MKKATKRLLYKFDWLSTILLIAGGVAWGLIGFFNYNLIESILPEISNIIYSAVGVSSFWILSRTLMNNFMKK